jgi:putative Mn2+ efflux pump MntP
MSLLEIFLLALALAADAFSVGAAVGLKHYKPRQLFRLSFHFGLFQALMPLLGAIVGSIFVSFTAGFNRYIACALLCLVGGRMIYFSLKDEKERESSGDPTKGLSLIGLSTAVSIDAFAAGMGLEAAEAPIVLAVTMIGLVTGFSTAAAMLLAKKIGSWTNLRLEMGAGIVLIGLGINILLF